MKTMKMRVDATEVFPSVEKMIYNMAWKTSAAYGIPFEECRSEASDAFISACCDYRPDRGQKFTTWCYYWIWCKLKDMVIARTRDPHIFIEIDEDLAGCAPAERSPSLELVDELSDDARELVGLILETPAEILKETRSPHALLNRVKRHMVKAGKRADDVDWAEAEIRRTFQRAWAEA